MSQEFKIEIISPDKSIYSGKIEEAILPCFEGQVTILKDHIPLIIFGNEKFYTEEGTVEFSDNNLLILSATVQNLKNINSDEINSMIKDAENKVSTNQITDKQKYILNYKIDTLKQIN